MIKNIFLDPVNLSFFLIILGIFVYYLIKLYKLSVATTSIAYKKIWDLYVKNLSNDVERKISIPSAEYFNIDNVCASYGVNIKHMRAVGSALVGLGILGTFVGLSIALFGADFSFSDQTTALSTIEELIDGMKTAFWTSALGMATSLIYGALYRRKANQLEIELEHVCEKLDKEYLLTPLNLMVEHNRLLVEVGQNLYKSVNDQSNILHEVCTNISSQLEQQKQTIDVIGVNICNHLVQQSQSMADIGTKLGQTMVEQNNLLTEMGRSIGNSVGLQLVNELNAAMEGLIAGVSESIHDNMMHASEHLKQSAEMLDVSTENLTSATGKIDSVTKTLPVTIDAMSNVIGDFQELLESVNDSTAELTTKNEAIVETLGNIGDSAIQLNEVIDTVNRTIANINEVIRNINIPQIIQAQKDQYTQVENLVTAQHKQISSLTGQQLDILNNIEDLRVCIEKLYESIGAVTNIKKDVKDIFEAINAGLQDHVNLLHNQTTGLLTTYTDKFTSATESINNTVGNLTESFDSAANTMFVSVSESAKKIEEATAIIAKNK